MFSITDNYTTRQLGNYTIISCELPNGDIYVQEPSVRGIKRKYYNNEGYHNIPKEYYAWYICICLYDSKDEVEKEEKMYKQYLKENDIEDYSNREDKAIYLVACTESCEDFYDPIYTEAFPPSVDYVKKSELVEFIADSLNLHHELEFVESSGTITTSEEKVWSFRNSSLDQLDLSDILMARMDFKVKNERQTTTLELSIVKLTKKENIK